MTRKRDGDYIVTISQPFHLTALINVRAKDQKEAEKKVLKLAEAKDKLVWNSYDECWRAQDEGSIEGTEIVAIVEV